MTVLIFGGTGSLGNALLRRFPAQKLVYAFSRDEAKHWTLRSQLGASLEQTRKFVVGDIRDSKRVLAIIRQIRPKTIIIAAALKQVDTCELSPTESVLTNLAGTQNVVDAVHEYNATAGASSHPPIESILFVSTDKACAPVNVYGMCKAISERLITSSQSPTRFLGVRYGNVLESRGSIIPLFKYQSENAEHITVTDPDMTRFVMTLDDSVNLIFHALHHGVSNRIYIPKLKAMRIGDLAEIFSGRSGKPIKVVGLRPGEKMHEALLNTSERVIFDGKHYALVPSYKQASDGELRIDYTSADDVMSKDELREHLTKLGILDAPLSSFTGRAIDEIVKDSK